MGDGVLGSVVFMPLQPAAYGSESGIDLITATVVGPDHLARAARWTTANLPSGFALHPAFPNPFNPETTLRIEIPSPATVRLDVYDAAGQRVRTLLARPLSAGEYTVRWDGRDAEGRAVGSGAYFARLGAPGFRAQRKMLLLR